MERKVHQDSKNGFSSDRRVTVSKFAIAISKLQFKKKSTVCDIRAQQTSRREQ